MLLNRNRPPVMNGIGAEKDPADLQWALSDPANVFVGHVKDAEAFVGVNENLIDAAEKLGYRQQIIRIIDDGFGRNVFTVYRFR